MYEIQLFGRLEVRTRGVRLSGDELGGDRARDVLALLALRGPLGTAELAALIGDHRDTVESQLAVLRRRLDPAVISSGDDGHSLTAEQVRVDVARFDELVAAASGRSPVGALRPLTAATCLAERPLLEDLGTSPWVHAAREHYRVRLVHALLDASGHALATGAPEKAARLAGRALELDPGSLRGRAILGEVSV